MEAKALWFAEAYGIVEYLVRGDKMIFYKTYPRERRTFKSVVDLNTMKETRTQVKRFYKPFAHIGKTQVMGVY